MFLDLSQRLDLRISNKHVVLKNFSIYYTWKNIRQQNKNSKLKIIAPSWHDELKLQDSSYSVLDIQDYIEYITKNVKHLIILISIFTTIRLIRD